MNKEMFNYAVLKKRMTETIGKARDIVDEKYVALVERGIGKLDEVIDMMKKQLSDMNIPGLFLNATALQQSMFMLVLAWLHLQSLTLTIPRMKSLVGDATGDAYRQIIADDEEAAYYSGRVLSAQFYIASEFPKYFGKMECIQGNEGSPLKARAEHFTGAPRE